MLTGSDPLVVRLAFAVGMAAAGAWIGAAKRLSHLALCVLISFAAGALLAVAVFEIIPESIRSAGVLPGILSALSGYALFWIITRFVFHVCPACAATHTEEHSKKIAPQMLVALAIHSFMDGLAVAGGEAHGHAGTGLPVLLAVAYHKLPEGLALALIAVAAGWSRASAFALAFGLEAVTTLGGGFTAVALGLTGDSAMTGLLLGHVGGGFIFLVIHALLGEAIKHHPKPTIAAALAGAASVLAAGFFAGDSL